LSVAARTLPRMTTDPQITAWLDQEDAHLAQLIRARRWAVQYVGPGEEDDEPAFGYTIGLFGLRHPELVVVGLDPEGTHEVLEHAAGLIAAGRNLVSGELLDGPGNRPGLVVEELPNPGEVVLAANRFYERPVEYSVPAYQLAWPDPEGRYPWEAGWSLSPADQPRPGTWRA
jgi:hypothetical protein